MPILAPDEAVAICAIIQIKVGVYVDFVVLLSVTLLTVQINAAIPPEHMPIVAADDAAVSDLAHHHARLAAGYISREGR